MAMLQVNRDWTDGSAPVSADRAPALPLSLFANRLRALKLLAMTLGFVALGIYYVAHPPHLRSDPMTERLTGAFVVLAFCLMSARFLWIAVNGLCIVHVDWAGLIIWRWAPITWSEIVDIRLIKRRIGNREYEEVGILVGDLQRLITQRSWLARLNLAFWPGRPATPILINCALLDVEPALLSDWLNEYRRHHS